MTRFFKSTDGRDSWHWDGSKMHLDGNGHVDSIFSSPDELMAELNVIETDEYSNALVSPEPAKPTRCHWQEDEEGNWESDCGETFIFTDEGPQENNFCFCPYCGGKMESSKFTPLPTREEIAEERGDRAYQEWKDEQP